MTLSSGLGIGGIPKEPLSRTVGKMGVILMPGAWHFGMAKMQAIRSQTIMSNAHSRYCPRPRNSDPHVGVG